MCIKCQEESSLLWSRRRVNETTNGQEWTSLVDTSMSAAADYMYTQQYDSWYTSGPLHFVQHLAKSPPIELGTFLRATQYLMNNCASVVTFMFFCDTVTQSNFCMRRTNA